MYYYAEPHAPIDHGSMDGSWPPMRFKDAARALRHHRRIHSRTQMVLFHTHYSRHQALEIIREQAFRDAVDEGPHLPFSYCQHLADCTYQAYQRKSNVYLEFELARLSGERPTVTD